MRSSVGRFVVIALLATALTACGDSPRPDDPVGLPSKADSSRSGDRDQEAGLQETLFDRKWLVEEGVWYIESGANRFPDSRGAWRAQENGLLGAQEPGALWFFLPALYGKYRVRIELLPSRPQVEQRFRDVVEVSYRARGPLNMGSFESFAAPMPVPRGDYRVRLSATNLDRVDAETARGEFVGRRYKVYSGLILLQLWQAPPKPDQVIREGTRFAVRANSEPPKA